jgi:hypothetical protein
LQKRVTLPEAEEYSSSMSLVYEPGVLEALSPLLEEAKTRAVEIRKDDELLGAVVSKDDYEIVRRAKAAKFLRVSKEFGEEVRARAEEDGLTPDDLLRMLDRKAS